MLVGLLADEQPESSIVNSVVAVVMVLINPALVGMPGASCSFDSITFDRCVSL